MFARLDTAVVDRQLAVLAWCRTRQVGGRRVVAIDGKTVRGARTAAMSAPHLVAALDHDSRVVLGQRAIMEKSNEIPAVGDLLARFNPADLAGCVITAGAMHTQDDTARAIRDADADYLFTRQSHHAKAAQGAEVPTLEPFFTWLVVDKDERSDRVDEVGGLFGTHPDSA